MKISSQFLFVCLFNYLVKGNGSGNPAVSTFVYTPNSNRGPRRLSLQTTKNRRFYITGICYLILLQAQSVAKVLSDFSRSWRRTKSSILILNYNCWNQDFYMISKKVVVMGEMQTCGLRMGQDNSPSCLSAWLSASRCGDFWPTEGKKSAFLLTSTGSKQEKYLYRYL